MAERPLYPAPEPLLPTPVVARWMRPLARFLAIESASGVVLLICTVIALVVANSPWAEAWDHFWHSHVVFAWGEWKLDYSLTHWVNDGLMAIFFFVVGLEIKREIVQGELREPCKAALPVMAAMGGMLAPAAIYFALQRGQPGEPGWGIPMATDIAFVVGFLALLGKRVPLGLKILLLALAIADDIGAVLVIAVFYSSSISIQALAVAAIGLLLTVAMNLLGVRRIAAYVIVGMIIWLAFLLSGVHPTVAGVVLGLLTPASVWVQPDVFARVVARAKEHLDDPDSSHGTWLFGELAIAAKEATSPLARLEHALHPWVAFVIMPLFALANAGVKIEASRATHPVALAVLLGLVIGKPLGIVLMSWLAVQMRIARLPTGVNWPAMVGAGCLAGIGFTMSLFIASLALEGELLDAGKLGTLTGSVISAVVGCAILLAVLKNPHPDARAEALKPGTLEEVAHEPVISQ